MKRAFLTLPIGLMVHLLAALPASAGTPVLGSIFFSSETGHFYEYVSGSFTWEEAKAAASSKTYNGLQGYLATITSEAENNFLVSTFLNEPDSISQWVGWLGGSDAETDGIWKWETGPEAGTVFWDNGTEIGYSNFLPGEPNNLLAETEDYLHMWQPVISGSWNDLPNDATIWADDHPEAATSVGYFVEYGGLESDRESVPEPSSAIALLTLGAIGSIASLKRQSSDSSSKSHQSA